MFVMTLPMLFDVDRNGRELNPSGPGLINSNLTVDMIGFVLEISAVQFFHAWLLVTMKRLETCPIDEWAIGREEVHQDRFGPVRALKMVFRNLWRLLTYQRNAQKKPRTYTPAPPTP